MTGQPPIGVLRWSARVIGLAPCVIGWTFLIGGAITEPAEDGEGIAVVVSLAVLTAAALFAWFRERAGGAAEVASAFGFAVVVLVTAGHNRLLAAALLPLPWLASGLLFLAIDRLERQRPAL